MRNVHPLRIHAFSVTDLLRADWRQGVSWKGDWTRPRDGAIAGDLDIFAKAAFWSLMQERRRIGCTPSNSICFLLPINNDTAQSGSGGGLGS